MKFIPNLINVNDPEAASKLYAISIGATCSRLLFVLHTDIIQCGPPPSTPHGQFVDCALGSYSVGHTCNITCDEGFSLGIAVQPTTVCLSDGDWDTSFTCEREFTLYT